MHEANGRQGASEYAGAGHHLKLALLWAFSALPGPRGEDFARRYLRRRRRPREAVAATEFEAALARLPRGAVCVDLGANVGEVTARMVEAGAEVHAVEPDPWAFARLAERFAGTASVHLHNAAVGTRDGTARLKRAPDVESDPARLSVGSSLIGPADWAGRHRSVEVPSVDILTLLRTIGRPVALLKMDIEGAEVAVLDRLIGAPEARQVGEVFCETHEVQMPELRPALRALRRRARASAAPRINLDWL